MCGEPIIEEDAQYLRRLKSLQRLGHYKAAKRIHQDENVSMSGNWADR